jgi:hypothetical protein
MKKKDFQFPKLEPGKVYVFNIRHDDGCGYWRNDDFDECDCDPDFETVEVNRENIEQVAEDYDKDETRAQAIRSATRRRN